MAAEADVAMIGAGIVGLCTAYALLDRGAAVTVYEVGAPGNGQSGGESRIFRHSHEDPRLVELARRSRALWEEWGRRIGVELVSDDGAIAIGPGVEDRLGVLERLGGVPARSIGEAELRSRLPLLAAGYDGPAMLDEGGGAIRTRAAIESLAGALGDALVADEVISIRSTGRGPVEVRAGGVRSEHSSVVVCAGRGTAALARGAGLSLPVRLAAHVRGTFPSAATRPPASPASRTPAGPSARSGPTPPPSRAIGPTRSA
jgi:sarcosine oxidase